jgi:UDP-N-acetylmuramoyl-L-alanyl-D-glutamate--2,6-diaminopimelate ligase
MKVAPKSIATLLAGVARVDPRYDCLIDTIALDSRKVQPGGLFIAYPGAKTDGRNFIDDAIARGASVVLCAAEQAESVSEQAGVPIFKTPLPIQVVSKIAARFYDHPSRALDIIGITGTNGKTSCAHYLAQAFAGLEKNCAVIGTLGSGCLGALGEPSLTTPDSIAVQAHLSAFLQQRMDCVAMEVSSHALAQGRVDKVEFTTAVFTNLTQDHLDYHHGMSAYAEAKLRLFDMFGLRHAVINLDDALAPRLLQRLAPTVQPYTYSLTHADADIVVTDLAHTAQGMTAQLSTPWGRGELRTGLLGEFNCANLLSVLACLGCRGHRLELILSALQQCTGVSGRMEIVPMSGGVQAVIDYAHTPDALKQALLALRPHCRGQIICVFGCGGDRDQGKRPLMGQIAQAYADQLIVTTDNPRFEDPQHIITAIRAGCEDRAEVQVVVDRRAAVATAYEQARAGDLILIAGKGHENYQLVNDKKLAYSDLETVQYLSQSAASSRS